MLDTLPDVGLSFPADTFLVAYQRFVEDLERALGIDEAEGVAHAYQAYARVCEEALSEPHVQQRVTSALGDLTAALNRALEHPSARAAIDEAATSYLHEVGGAWAELSP